MSTTFQREPGATNTICLRKPAAMHTTCQRVSDTRNTTFQQALRNTWQSLLLTPLWMQDISVLQQKLTSTISLPIKESENLSITSPIGSLTASPIASFITSVEASICVDSNQFVTRLGEVRYIFNLFNYNMQFTLNLINNF